MHVLFTLIQTVVHTRYIMPIKCFMCCKVILTERRLGTDLQLKCLYSNPVWFSHLADTITGAGRTYGGNIWDVGTSQLA